jgi:hypothetical protein
MDVMTCASLAPEGLGGFYSYSVGRCPMNMVILAPRSRSPIDGSRKYDGHFPENYSIKILIEFHIFRDTISLNEFA